MKICVENSHSKIYASLVSNDTCEYVPIHMIHESYDFMYYLWLSLCKGHVSWIEC